MAIKKVGIERKYSSYAELKQRNVVAQGWCYTGDLAFLTRANNLDKYIPIVADDDQKAYNAFRQLLRDIHTGDIILAFEGNTICGITEIPPDFVYLYEEGYDYANCIFPVNWVDWKDFCPDPKLSSQGGQGIKGIENCNLSVNDYIKKNWKSFVLNNNISVQP